MLFRCGTTCCLLYQRASLRYQQRCSACFTEKQRDYQFSCHCDSRYVGHTSQRLQDRINNMSPNLSVLALLPKNAYFQLVGANLPPRLIPSLLLLIQPLDFIFYKILPALNIIMTADFLFLPKAAHLFIYLLLRPLSSKLLTPPSADKKNSCTA